MVVADTYATAGEASVSTYRRCHSDLHCGGPETVDAKETNVLILLPLLRRLSVRTRLVVGLAVTAAGLFLTIIAPVHGVIAVIVGAIFLVSAGSGRVRARLSYPSR
jgi:hypothetical protein